jgi:hypothetical protein
MTSVGEGLHAAALVEEEDIRKIDAGETKATAEQRAFLVGAVRGLTTTIGRTFADRTLAVTLVN